MACAVCIELIRAVRDLEIDRDDLLKEQKRRQPHLSTRVAVVRLKIQSLQEAQALYNHHWVKCRDSHG